MMTDGDSNVPFPLLFHCPTRPPPTTATMGISDGNSGSSTSGLPSITAGIDRDVRPWLNLADDLRSLEIDQDISIPQVSGGGGSGRL